MPGSWPGSRRPPLLGRPRLKHDEVSIVTLSHNVASNEQVDAVFADALRVGARAIKPPQDVFWGGYHGYFADPDGYLWEVAFNPFTDLS